MSELDTVIEMRQSGLPQQVIASKLGIPQTTISYMLSKAGVPHFIVRPKVHRKTSQLDEATVVEMRRSGLPQQVIADKFGVSRVAVSNMLRKAGIPHFVVRPKTHRKTSELDEATVIDLRRSGLSQRAIADKLGVSAPTISNMLKKAGVPRVVARQHKTAEIDEAMVVDLRKSGLPLQAIADKFGVSTHPILKILKTAGVPRKVARQKSVKIREQARAMKQDGKSYAEIGRALGISRQRAQQLLSLPHASRQEFAEQKGNRCELCGRPAKKLDAHHNTYAGDPDQLLCTSCHKKLDAQLGFSGKGKPHSRRAA